MSDNGRPYAAFLGRLLQEVNPRSRDRLLHNFVLNKIAGQAATRRLRFAAEEGIVPPFLFVFSPTMRCNRHCDGCYAGGYSRDEEMSPELIDNLLEQAKEMGIYLAIVLGGEPFLREDMWDTYRRHQDMLFLVFTNGTLIDEAAAARLGELGNVFPAVSLEGFRAETDARRGEGTFDQVTKAMALLHRAGVMFGFSSMITSRNLETVISDEFNDMLVAAGALFGWHFLYLPLGADPDLSLMPSAEQRDRLRREGAARIRQTRPMFVIDFWNDAPLVGGCIAGGKQFFHVNSRGDVEPCVFVHYAVDNVKERSLREVLRSPYFRAIRAQQPYSDNLLRPCLLLDHPGVLREVAAEHHAHATYPAAEQLLTDLASGLDRYAAQVGAAYDPVWKGYVASGFKPPLAPT
jgi:MoaA/NifB/PqqE/SkfB family radical SAM enzyme